MKRFLPPVLLATAVLLLVVVGRLHTAPAPAADAPSLVVTTSMLECAVRELDPAAALRLVRLVPPASCPGQVDLSPRVLPELTAARVVLRHDFQAPFEAQLARSGVTGVTVVAVQGGGSLVVPAHYLGVVRQVERELERLLPQRAGELRVALAGVERRLDALERAVRTRPAPWRMARVVASVQQAELARWLGLDVVGELPRAEETSPRRLEELLVAAPELIVGNLQEGREAALSLGQRLGRPVAVLSSFPGVEGYGEGFDQLLSANLDRLDAAWAAR